MRPARDRSSRRARCRCRRARSPAASAATWTASRRELDVSQDGRYVAFSADADALSADANPDVANVFRKDRVTGAVVFVSRASGAGGAAPARSGSDVTISDDGGRVAWITEASLDPADADANEDVYVRDIATDTTILASPGTADDVEGYDLSGDGAFVALATTEALAGADDANGVLDVYRRRLADGATALASRQAGAAQAGNGASRDPSISDDGRWIAFKSAATNLVAGYVAGAGGDVFARDMTAALGYLVSNKAGAATTGANGPSNDPQIAGAPARRDRGLHRLQQQRDRPLDRRRRHLRGGERLPAPARRDRRVRAGEPCGRRHRSQRGQPRARRRHLGLGRARDVRLRRPEPHARPRLLRRLHARRRRRHDGPDVGRHEVRRRAGDRGRRLARRLAQRRRRHHARQRSRPDGRVRARLPGRPAGVRLAPAGRGAVPGAGGEHRGRRHRRPHDQRRRPLRRLLGLLVAPARQRRAEARSTAATRPRARSSSSRAPTAPTGPRPATRAWSRRSAPTGRAWRSPPTGAWIPRTPTTTAQVYLRDLAAATTTLVSRADGAGGALPDSDATDGHISADGRHVTFLSTATNLGVVGGAIAHVYLRDVAAGTTLLVDRATGADGAIGNGDAFSSSPSADGRLVVFTTRANNLDPADPGPSILTDVYVRDTVAATTTLAVAAERARRRQGDGLVERGRHQRGRPHGRVPGGRRDARDRGRAVGRHGPGGRARARERAEHAREPRARRRGRGRGRGRTRASAATAR